MQPVFTSTGLFTGESYPVSESLSRNGLYLPCGTPIKKRDVFYVCNMIKELASR
jgi:perosamine synthetase